MGYFDALTSSYFKTAADGRKLFYPWGVLGRGYAIATEQDQQRLRRQLKIYTIVSFVLIVGACVLQTYLVAILIAVALIVFYLFWVRRLIAGLQPSGEGLSMRESFTAQALAHSGSGLWAMETGFIRASSFRDRHACLRPGQPAGLGRRHLVFWADDRRHLLDAGLTAACNA